MQQLPFDDTRDLEAVQRGFLGTRTPCTVTDATGRVVWDAESYAFLSEDEAPDTVHASLWRQSQLVVVHGLFEVVPGIYQVRGFDLSNITFIEGDEGVIVVDPLISTETAAAALALYREHRGDRAVTGVVYTHSHVDHFGGVKGVLTQAEADAGVPVIAPAGFLEHAIAENVYAGTAMARRAGYMYGAALPRGPRGQVGAGLGQTTSTGTVSLIAPTVHIRETGEELVVDGVRFVFQMAPGSEAPAEFHFHLPAFRALCMAENATHTLHNILTIRGALVRDARAWAGYLTEAIELFGDTSEVVFASHHWPTWGRDELREYLGLQRDLYAYLHDQTLRALNNGLTGAEIAEEFVLPPALERSWHARGYYGSVSHNVKAIYQRYMGWYDGNPARLWQLPPADAGRRYVNAIGGADAVLAIARTAAAENELRWAAQLLDHLVFAEPENEPARELLAEVLERIGFASENGPWRDAYLSGAYELREGVFGTPTEAAAGDLLGALSPELFFDSLAVRIDGPRAWELDIATRWIFPDHGTDFRVTLRNGVLVAVSGAAGPVALTLTVPRPALVQLATGDLPGAVAAGLQLDGDASSLESVFGVLDAGNPSFPIMTP
ncbi:MAG: MBL fold metallo-hydrolase [Micrococcales bacterium]|nr:MBL fold metallo-hydrolase [Micrococcales bacterium]OJX69290.1 MAG: alkyl/aryl-sulfatase [Micrococcales bacterium 72-143]